MQTTGTAANPVDYTIDASQTADRYITALSFVIADGSQVANEFGNLGSPLTNGCQLLYKKNNGEEIFIHEALQTNFDFVRLCLGDPAFGQTTNAMRMSNVSGSSEAFIPVLDMKRVFGVPYGVRLIMGSNQQLIMRIRDTTTVVDQFDVIAYGFDRLEPK